MAPQCLTSAEDMLLAEHLLAPAESTNDYTVTSYCEYTVPGVPDRFSDTTHELSMSNLVNSLPPWDQ